MDCARAWRAHGARVCVGRWQARAHHLVARHARRRARPAMGDTPAPLQQRHTPLAPAAPPSPCARTRDGGVPQNGLRARRSDGQELPGGPRHGVPFLFGVRGAGMGGEEAGAGAVCSVWWRGHCVGGSKGGARRASAFRWLSAAGAGPSASEKGLFETLHQRPAGAPRAHTQHTVTARTRKPPLLGARANS